MNSKQLLSLLSGAILLTAPLSAFAHEHRTFTIGDKQYNITIGSMNEPIAVDDKSGVELMISQLGGGTDETAPHDDDGDDDGPAGIPVGGLESSLKVEVRAGDKRKVFDLKPTYGTPGAYEAVFYPTVQTTYTYRLFGTINATAVDISFTCNPAGHPLVQDDTTAVKLSDNVTQVSKGGAFGCPGPKADLQFPETGMTIAELSNAEPKSGNNVGMALETVGFVFSIIALARTRRSAQI